MVGIVAGVGLGLERSSANLLGAAGLLGTPSQGIAGDTVYVNAASGNLIDQHADEILLGVGPTDVLSRNYNSLTGYSNNGVVNGWLENVQRKVDLASLTGVVNTAGSTIKRLAADGSDVLFTYDAVRGLYIGNEGGGAYDTLSFNSGANQWTWTEGKSQLKEVYDGANGGRIMSSTDTDFNALTFTYTGALLTKVTTASTAHTEYTSLNYTGNNLTSVVTTYWDVASSTTKTLTRVSYGYANDGSNRLTSVNSLSTGGSYVTTYGYDGSSDRINSITQTDGSSLTIVYQQVNGTYRVQTLTQTAASGVTRITSFSYDTTNRITTVTDPLGIVTKLYYDTAGELIQTVVDPTGLNLSTTFTYDPMGDVLSATTPGAQTVTYAYDGMGNRTSQVDAAGNTVVRTYGAMNQLLSETRFLVPAGGGAASSPVTTWFVYSAADHLRYSVTSQGDVTQFQYNAQGQQTSAIQYGANAYSPVIPSPPAASASSQTVANNVATPIAVSLSGGVASSIAIVTQTAHGTLSVNGASVTYTPTAGYTGADSFTYKALNAGGVSSNATVTLTVAAPTLASVSPTAAASSQTVAKNSSSDAIALSLSGGLATGITVTTGPGHGTYSLSGATLSYTPTSGYTGSDSISYKATNAAGASSIVAVTLTVATPGASAPTANAVSTVVAPDSTANNVVLNIAGTVTSVSVFANPTHGTVAVNGTQITYTPNAGYFGADSFQYKATNSNGTSAAATATIAVATPATPSVSAVTAAAAYNSGSPVVSSPIVLNITGIATSVTVSTAPAHGSTSVSGTTITYTPTAGYSGADSFRYTATNASGTSSAVTASITVAAAAGPYTETQLNAWVAAISDLSTSKRTDTTYDFRGNISTVTAYGKTTTAGAGDTTATTEISKTTYVYDQFGKLLQRLPDAAQNAYSYQSLQRLPTASAEVYTYDGMGRILTSTEFGSTNTTAYVYDDAHAKTTITLSNGLTRTSSYDLAGELISYSEAGSGVTTSTTSYKYDADGRLMSVTDPTNLASYLIYDNAGREVASVLPDGALTEYVYNANGLLVETIAHANLVSSANMTTLANATASSPVALATIRPTASASDRYAWRVYDAALRLIETIDAAGAVVQYAYDGANELTSTTAYSNLLSPSQLTSFQSAPPTTLTLPTANASADRTTRYFYDNDGRLLASLSGEGYLTQTLYDNAGQKSQTIAYATQAGGSLWASGTLAQLLSSVGTSASDIHNWFVYDQRGFLRGTVDGEGEVTQYHYTPLGDVDQKIVGQQLSVSTLLTTPPTLSTLTGLGATGPAIDLTNYTYNLYGQIASQVRTTAAGTETDTYQYDALRRLTGKTTMSGTGDARTVGWGYDLRSRITSATTGNNNTSNYVYDAADRLISKTDAAGNKTLYYYDVDGRLVYQINALGEVVKYGYDAFAERSDITLYGTRIASGTLAGMSGGMSSSADSIVAGIANGSVDSHSHIDYNVTGTLADTVDAMGVTTASWAYDAFRDVTGRTDRLTASLTTQTTETYDRRGLLLSSTADSQSGGIAAATVLAYDAFGRAIQVTDPNGDVRTTAFDRAGRMVSKTDAAGETTTYAYDARGNLTTFTDRTGYVTTFGYDQFERTITQTIDPTGVNIVATTKKNAYGQSVSITDGRGNQTTFAYDQDGNLKTEVQDAGSGHLNLTTTMTYDPDDRLASVTDPRGYVTTYSYDAASRVLTRQVDPTGLNLTTTYAYDAKGEEVTITDPASVATQITYDLDGRKTLVQTNASGLNIRTQYQYDLAGRALTVTEAYGSALPRVTNYAYDNLGRLTQSVVDPGHLNLATNYAYDKDGNAVAKTDAASNKTLYVYDSENRLIYAVDPLGDVTQTIYDTAGRVITVHGYAAAVGSSTLATWQSQTTPLTAAQVTGAISTSSSDHVTNYVYDGAGRLRYAIDPNLRLTEYAYDANGNLIHRIEYAGSITTNSSYTLAYVQGQITTLGMASNTANRTTRYVYDAANREAFCIDANTDAQGNPLSGVTAYSYDANGNQTKRVQYATAYTTAGDQSLATLQSWAAANGTSSDRVTRTVYDDASRAVYQVDGEGHVTGYVYDADGHVTKQTRYAEVYTVTDGVTQSSLATQLSSANLANAAITNYAYDTAGRLTQVTDPLGIVTLLALDAMGRVTDSTLASGTSDAATTHFVYDAAGRATSQTTAYGAAEAATTSYTYDGLGRALTTVDADNHTTTRTYDADGRVLTITDPLNHVITNQYDAFGNLVKVTDQRGNSGFFYYDLLNRLTLQVDPEGYATATTYTIGNQTASLTRYALRTTGTPTVTTPPTINTSSADETTTFTRDKLDRLTAVTDAGNYTETYVLNAFGDRTSVTNKLGGVTTNTYDHRGLLLSQTLPITSVTSSGSTEATSVTTTYAYDARGNRTQMVEASGLTEQRTTNYSYDLNNRLTQQTGDQVQTLANDLVTTANVTPTDTYVYDKRGNLIEHDDANGARTLSYYDHNNRKIAQVDALGALTNWAYDGAGNITTQTVYGDFVTLPSTPGGAPPSPVNPNNDRQTTYAYDLDNRLTTTTIANILTGSWSGTAYTTQTGAITSTNVYDAAGNVVQTIDGDGNSSYFYYDKLGRKIGQVDPGAYLTTYTLDQDGNVTSQTQFATALAPGFSTTTLPTDTTNGADRTTNFTYDKNGRRLTEQRLNVAYSTINTSTGVKTDSNGTASITYAYNGLGEVTSKTEATGEATTYSYDSEGRQTALTAPSYTGVDFVTGNAATVQPVTNNYYDGLGDLTRTRVGNGATPASTDRITTYSYGAGGRLASTTDATNSSIGGSGNTQTFAYDAAGHVVKVGYSRLQSGGTSATEAVATHFDLLGRQIYQASASYSGSTWSFGDSTQTQYDPYGEVTGKGLNGLFQETSTYDGAGRLATTTAGDGSTKVYLYDGAGNQTLAITSAGTSLAGDTVAAALSAITVGGVIAGGYVAGIDPTITVYDARGEATQVRQTWRQLDTNSSDNVTLLTSKAYNAFGDVTAQVNARGYETDFTYNTEGKLTQQLQPQVSATDATGAQSNVRPAVNSYYDLSGRLVATQDANGNLNTRLLLAGSGYGGSDAKETDEFHPDTGHPTWAYDVFGDTRAYTNELGNVDKRTYDGMDRLLTDTHPLTHPYGGGAAFSLIDFYAYDGLGQRIDHTNSVLNTSLAVSGYSSTTLTGSSGVKETTDYDLQGRVTKEVDLTGLASHATTYTYAWSSSLATAGLGTFGGWTKTTTNPAGLTETDQLDYFGHQVSRTDFGGNVSSWSYDTAARIAGETIVKSSVTLQTLTNTYYDTGKMAAVADSYFIWGIDGGLIQTNSTLSQSFTYDANGNRVTEVYGGSLYNPVASCFTSEPTQTQVSYENATATYDALDRTTQITDQGQSGAHPATINYEYDQGGDIRRIQSSYTDVVSGNNTNTDYWYKYDSMNRFTLVQGQLVNGTRGSGITRGYVDANNNGGKDIAYDLAGDRATVSTTKAGSQDDVHTEYYVYSEDGQVTQVKIADAFVTSGTGGDSQAGSVSSATLRGSDLRDAMGRDLTHSEYKSNGTTVAFSDVETFNNLSQVTQDQASTLQSNGSTTNVITTTYDYLADVGGGTYTGAYQGGVVIHSHSTGQIVNGSGSIPTTDTVNTYVWFDAPRQQEISYTPDTSHPSTVYTSQFSYDANQHLRAVYISDGRPRTVNYITDENLQVMSRVEYSSANSNPAEYYYYYNGNQVGDIGNNGPSVTDYATQIANRSAAAQTGAFQYGSAVSYSDFSQGYSPIGAYEQQSAQTYTVKDGDTLQSIASQLWGDSNLWYLIAQANGLNGTETLQGGTTLSIPDKVANLQQSSSTFRVYDPNKAIGNVQPTTPAPPAHHHTSFCGVIGQILSVIVAIAVTLFIGIPIIGPVIGDAAGQGVRIAFDLQHGFNFKELGQTAVAAAVNFLLPPIPLIRPLLANVISQGIDLALGLQKKFDWTGVATSAVESFAGDVVSQELAGHGLPASSFPNQLLTGTAKVIAGGAARSLITGQDFGSSVIAELPNVIGQTIGNDIAGAMAQQQYAPAQPLVQPAPPVISAEAPVVGIDPMAGVGDLAPPLTVGDGFVAAGPADDNPAQASAFTDAGYGGEGQQPALYRPPVSPVAPTESATVQAGGNTYPVGQTELTPTGPTTVQEVVVTALRQPGVNGIAPGHPWWDIPADIHDVHVWLDSQGGPPRTAADYNASPYSRFGYVDPENSAPAAQAIVNRQRVVLITAEHQAERDPLLQVLAFGALAPAAIPLAAELGGAALSAPVIKAIGGFGLGYGGAALSGVQSTEGRLFAGAVGAAALPLGSLATTAAGTTATSVFGSSLAGSGASFGTGGVLAYTTGFVGELAGQQGDINTGIITHFDVPEANTAGVATAGAYVLFGEGAFTAVSGAGLVPESGGATAAELATGTSTAAGALALQKLLDATTPPTPGVPNPPR
ncbi:MAG: Ig-like domain-containing protein [Caulobacterales bacterium]